IEGVPHPGIVIGEQRATDHRQCSASRQAFLVAAIPYPGIIVGDPMVDPEWTATRACCERDRRQRERKRDRKANVHGSCPWRRWPRYAHLEGRRSENRITVLSQTTRQTVCCDPPDRKKAQSHEVFASEGTEPSICRSGLNLVELGTDFLRDRITLDHPSPTQGEYDSSRDANVNDAAARHATMATSRSRCGRNDPPNIQNGWMPGCR